MATRGPCPLDHVRRPWLAYGVTNERLQLTSLISEMACSNTERPSDFSRFLVLVSQTGKSPMVIQPSRHNAVGRLGGSPALGQLSVLSLQLDHVHP
jgi:hypothetical protein